MTDAREALVALIRTTVLIFRPEAERLADAILAAGWTPPGERVSTIDVAEAIASELEAHANIATRPGQLESLHALAERVRRLAAEVGPLKAGVMALTGLSSDEVDALGGVREDDDLAPVVPDNADALGYIESRLRGAVRPSGQEGS